MVDRSVAVDVVGMEWMTSICEWTETVRKDMSPMLSMLFDS